MKLSDTIKKVIALAEVIHDYWERELPKRYRDYPFVHEGETDGPPPPEQKKLERLLARLPEEVVYQLVLIMYIGRGDIPHGQSGARLRGDQGAVGDGAAGKWPVDG